MSGRRMNGGRDQPNFCDVTTPTLVRPRTCGILASPFQGHTYVPAHKQQNNPYECSKDRGYSKRTSSFYLGYCYCKDTGFISFRFNQEAVLLLFGGSSRINQHVRETRKR
jgi:hypothetical protein